MVQRAEPRPCLPKLAGMPTALYDLKRSLMAKDPVCGMTVDPAKAAGTHEHNGQQYYFCAQSCLGKFRLDPERYLKPELQLVSIGIGPAPPREKMPEAAADYTCPMHPEVREAGPGACPDCGMGLEPVVVAAPKTKTEYICPMHPEVVRAEPGRARFAGWPSSLAPSRWRKK